MKITYKKTFYTFLILSIVSFIYTKNSFAELISYREKDEQFCIMQWFTRIAWVSFDEIVCFDDEIWEEKIFKRELLNY